MEKNYLTQSEIASTELIYSQAVTAFEEANKNMAKAVEKLINTLSKIDESLLKPKRKMIRLQFSAKFTQNDYKMT